MTDQMTITEVAGALGINRRTALAWVQNGRLRGYKTPGGHWRVPRAALEEADLTAARFAALIGVHKITVRRWCESGKLKAHRAGGNGHWLIPLSEVDRVRSGASAAPAGTAGARQGEAQRRPE